MKSNPILYFDEAWYLWLYGDVRRMIADGLWSNALSHYVAAGMTEGRSPNPIMDEQWYLDRYPDIREAVERGGFPSGAHHFWSAGMHERRRPSRHYDETWYLGEYPDVRAAVSDQRIQSGYHHFLAFGLHEGRRPGPEFPEREYLRVNPTAAEEVRIGAFSSGFEHYVRFGMLNGCHEPMSGELEHEHSRHDSRSFHEFRADREFEHFMALGHRLDFTPSNAPVVSVIVVVRNSSALTWQCLNDLNRHAGTDIELIVLDNASDNRTRKLLDRIDGARIIHHQRNLHFLRAANRGAGVASTPVLLFLNSDAFILPDAIRHAMETLEKNPDAGAVGAKLIRPNGTLEEAGCGLLANGSPYGYGNGHSPFDSRFMCTRESLFTSGAFFLTPRQIFDELGGFDDVFSPAYFEEADYCFRARENGFRTLVDTRAVVVHFGRGSGSRTPTTLSIFQKNKLIFRARHQAVLASAPGSSRDHLRLPELPGRARRILIIDSAPPVATLGSGFPRTAALVNALDRLGYQITCFSMGDLNATWDEIYRHVPRHVECIVDIGPEGLANFLKERRGTYDTLWISRPRNRERVRAIQLHDESLLAGIKVIYDAEAVFAERDVSHAILVDDHTALANARHKISQEVSAAAMANAIVTVTPLDQEQFRRLGVPTFVVSHAISASPAKTGFAERHGLLFVGAVHHEGSPNCDSLRWFVTHVYPRLREQIPGITLTVAGNWSIDVPPHLQAESITFVGKTDDLSRYYDAARVFIAPTRFGAGLPLKVIEAAAHGVPVCATDLLFNQLGWDNNSISAAAATPEEFLESLQALYLDESRWKHVQKSALQRIEMSFSAAAFSKSLSAVLPDQMATMRHREAVRTPTRPRAGAPQSFSYRNSVLLFEGRTGSTHLTELLNQHPRAEFASEHAAAFYDFGWKAQEAWINDFYERRTEEQLSRKNVEELICIGFRNKLREIRDPDMLRELLIDRDAQVIHMRRRNRVKQTISSIRAMDLAEMTGRYNINRDDSISPLPAGNIDPGRFEIVLKWLEHHERLLNSFISSLPLQILTVDYEELVNSRGKTLHRVCEFLGLDDFSPKDVIVKHTDDDLSQAILNFEQLAGHFSGSIYGEMFHSDPAS